MTNHRLSTMERLLALFRLSGVDPGSVIAYPELGPNEVPAVLTPPGELEVDPSLPASAQGLAGRVAVDLAEPGTDRTAVTFRDPATGITELADVLLQEQETRQSIASMVADHLLATRRWEGPGPADLTETVVAAFTPMRPEETPWPQLSIRVSYEEAYTLVDQGFPTIASPIGAPTMDIHGRTYDWAHGALLMMIGHRYGDGLLQLIATLPDLRVQSRRCEESREYEVILSSRDPRFEPIQVQAAGIEFGTRVRMREGRRVEEVVAVRGRLFSDTVTGRQNILTRAGGLVRPPQGEGVTPVVTRCTYTYPFPLRLGEFGVGLPGVVALPQFGPRTLFESMPITDQGARWAAAWLWQNAREFVERHRGHFVSLSVALSPDEIIVCSTLQTEDGFTVAIVKRPDAPQYARRLKLSHKERKTPDVAHDQHQGNQNPVHTGLARRRARTQRKDGR